MRSTLTAVPTETAPGLRMFALMALCAGGLAGTAVQLQQRELAASGVMWIVLAATVLAGVLSCLRLWRAAPLGSRSTLRSAPRPMPWRAGALLLACTALAAVAAYAIASLRAHERLAERLGVALEGRDIEVTGIVAQLPRTGPQGTRFLFEVERATLDGAVVALPRTISLAWYRAAEPDALLLGPQTVVRAGQRWRFTVRLRQPHGEFNPGGFDLELWLFERGIGATGQVRSRVGDTTVLLAEAAGAPVERARQRVRDAIERRLAGPAQGRIAGVIAALAVGDQAAIERDDWDLFRLTGVAHLMSISGLHVTMFAWLAGGVIGWLWRRSTRAMLRLPAPLASRWGGVAVALAYAVFAGWGVPAQRTVCMLATVAVLRSLGVRWPLQAVLLVVAAVVVAVDPWALLQPGFWLSFVAVGLLVVSQPVDAPDSAGAGAGAPGAAPAQRAITAAKAALRQQAVATVGLAPLSLLFFQQVSLVGFAANLVAIPVVTLLVTPLSLLGVLVAPLWDAAAAVLSALMALLQWLAGSAQAGARPWWPAVWTAAAAPPWAVAAGLLGGLVAVLPLPWALRALALPLLLPLMAPPVPRPAEGRFEFVALDIGQGTAALVRTRSHLLVYDTGPAFAPDADAGARHVLPLLRRRGETHIDLLMLSHRDSDHVGGAAALLAALPVRQVSSSLEDAHPLLAQARAAGAAVQRCAAGQHWDWDGVRFEVLHPAAADHSLPGLKANALSCVLRVGAVEASVLLTGDIEAAQEAALLAREGAHLDAAREGAHLDAAREGAHLDAAREGAPTHPTHARPEGAPGSRLRATVLLVPHHGSRTSSSAAFIDAVAPQRAVVQAAYRSRFGHPAADVVARYHARGIALARSDRCGALTLAPGGEVRCEREAARRYWHHRVTDR